MVRKKRETLFESEKLEFDVALLNRSINSGPSEQLYLDACFEG